MKFAFGLLVLLSLNPFSLAKYTNPKSFSTGKLIQQIKRQTSTVDTSLIPAFGIQAGVNPTGMGNCEGVNGIEIPCTCPPDQTLFNNDLIANVANGRPVNNSGAAPITFPSDNSIASALARFNAATETLQNLFGAGVGCPQAATTWGAQVSQLQALQAQGETQVPTDFFSGSSSTSGTSTTTKSVAVATSTPSSVSSSGTTVDTSLIPAFGIQAGVDPDGTGNCQGVNGIAIPCSCPPDQTLFNNDLILNVANGRPVNNSKAAPIQFPSDNSIQSQLARFNAATETLQNLFGAGVGCPQAATTWGAQVAALQAQLKVKKYRG